MKIKAFIVALAVLVVPFLVVTSSVGAQTFRSSESTLIASDETIDGAAYIAGSTVDIAGTIKGDLYCAGQNVTISGEVDGDVLCAGQTLSISGKVTGNVRAAGQTVAVRGDIGKNVTIAGQTITLEREGRVGQDATLLGQSVAVTSPVARDLVINSSSATINAAIGRNVTANIESLQLSREANITGDLTYTSPVKLTRADGATVTGKVTYTEFKESTETATAGKAAVPFAAYFVWLVMLIASAVLFALLFPQVLSKTTALAAPTVPQGLLTTLVGFVAGIVMPFVIIFLMVTVLGIPFALVALLAWLLILAVSGAFAAYLVGRLVWQAQTNVILIMLVGSAIVAILMLIPLINVLVGFICVWYGSGAILVGLKTLLIPVRYSTVVPRAKKA